MSRLMVARILWTSASAHTESNVNCLRTARSITVAFISRRALACGSHENRTLARAG